MMMVGGHVTLIWYGAETMNECAKIMSGWARYPTIACGAKNNGDRALGVSALEG